MASDPSSGPGAGLISSKATAITSAQIKALYTTPAVVTPTPRSDQIIVPLHWAAVATDSDTLYVNGPGGMMGLGYSVSAVPGDLAPLLSNLTAGNPSFSLSQALGMGTVEVGAAAGLPLEIMMDTGNLTAGDFGITFTLLYTIIPAS